MSKAIIRSFKNVKYHNHKRITFCTQSQRIYLSAKVNDIPGALNEVLQYFYKHNVSLTHIESKTNLKENESFDILINFNGRIGEVSTDRLLNDLYKHYDNRITLLDGREVPWFPTQLSDLDRLNQNVLLGGIDLVSDHPGFSDQRYCMRRKELAADIVKSYVTNSKIPHIDYNAVENDTWNVVYSKLKALHKDYACHEYLEIFNKMEKICGYSNIAIPQAQDISDFLMSQTGFRLRPVAGLLSARDFLSGLAFRTFFCTQYIRHSSLPLYTPEPDICHEYIGHVPMFADPDFADFSQEIGLASLGATDEDIKKLAACYWFSVEFGLLYEQSKTTSCTATNNSNFGIWNKQCMKAYGAGLLSSFGELEYSCNPSSMSHGRKSNYLSWDPVLASNTEYPITTYQPTYFVANSLSDAKLKMRNFCTKHISRPFNIKYDSNNNTVWVDRAINIKQPGHLS